MTTTPAVERDQHADRAAIAALTPDEQGLVRDFAERHGFPWEDYADIFDDLLLEGREPSFHEVVRALLGRHVAALREGMATMTSPVDLHDLAVVSVWVDRCLTHFLPLDTVLPPASGTVPSR